MRVISVFKCHKACPLISASSIAVAVFLKGSVIHKTDGVRKHRLFRMKITIDIT